MNYNTSDDTNNSETTDQLIIYSILLACTVFFAAVQGFIFCFLSVMSATRLHNSMFAAVIRTTVRFFEQNPSGN